MTAPAMIVAQMDPATGLPMRNRALMGCDDLALARKRASELSALAAHQGHDAAFGVWRLVCEFKAEVHYATSPSV